MKLNSIYIEILDFRDKPNLYPAERYVGTSDDDTYEMFFKCQKASDELGKNSFIVDLCKADGTMIDTVQADEKTFRMVTGKEPEAKNVYSSQCDEACSINMANRKKHI